MNEKNESALGLAPFELRLGSSSSASLIPFNASRSITREGQRILDVWHEQTLVMEGTKAKTTEAMNFIGEIHLHGVSVFDDATASIVVVKNGAQGKEHQAYTYEFAERGIQVMGRHLMGVMEVGATSIGMEVQRSLYPLPEKKGFWKRVLGQ